MANIEGDKPYFKEAPQGARVFVIRPLKDLTTAEFQPDPHEVLDSGNALCCGSSYKADISPVGFQLGSYHELQFVCERCASVVCSCGQSQFPSKKAHSYITQAGREIRDFIDGAINRDNPPDDWLYQYISPEDIAQVREFRTLIVERARIRDEQMKKRRDERNNGKE